MPRACDQCAAVAELLDVHASDAATALRDLIEERDALRAEVRRLRKVAAYYRKTFEMMGRAPSGEGA